MSRIKEFYWEEIDNCDLFVTYSTSSENIETNWNDEETKIEGTGQQFICSYKIITDETISPLSIFSSKPFPSRFFINLLILFFLLTF